MSPSNETAALSARERQVLRLVALGSACPEVADELWIAHDTVRTHVRNAMRKLAAKTRVHAVTLALKLGADVNATSKSGDTALHAAAALGVNTVVQALVDSGARLDAKNKNGATPLKMVRQRRTAALLKKLGATE